MSCSRRAVVAVALVLLGLTGCQGRSGMNGLQERWAAVTRSQSPADEARAVGALKGYLKDAGIPYSAVVVDQDGKETPYVEFAGERAIRSVRITFHTRQGDFRAPEWSPRDTENFYALFLE